VTFLSLAGCAISVWVTLASFVYDTIDSAVMATSVLIDNDPNVSKYFHKYEGGNGARSNRTTRTD